VAGALVLVLAAVALTARAATLSAPPLTLQRAIAAQLRIPGRAPRLAWPREGQAAVQVEGIGSLGGVRETQPVPIASVAKVMTAYLTLLRFPLAAREQGFTLTLSAADVREQQRRAALGESTVAVRAGERISERQALEALLIPSANNIAALLAVHDAGSIGAFVAEMNSTARALGMSATAYTDPSGFNHTTLSTASDQLKLAQLAMRQPTFAAIVSQPSAKLPVSGRVLNTNGLAGSDGYVGVKTGSDGAAGGCLVFAKQFPVEGHRLMVVGVVLGQRRGPLIGAALASSRRLGDSAAAAVKAQVLLPSQTDVLRIRGTGAQRAMGVTAEPLRVLGWGGLTVPVHVRPRAGLTHVGANERVGSLDVGTAGSLTIPLLATRAIAGPSLGWRVSHLAG
jgi:D-alanyl-D-alanine carboxypeptidase (penicillin-binding protein 5/6)